MACLCKSVMLSRSSSSKSVFISRFLTPESCCFQHSGKSMRCVFKEIHTPDHFTEFQSAANELWYIGFRRNGKPLKGFKWRQHRRKRKNRQRQRRLRHRQNKGKRTRERRSTTEQQARQAQRRKTCYQFTKRHISYAVESNGFLPGADFGQLVPQNRGTT